MRLSTEERFWSRVNKDGPTQSHMDSACWEWTGPLHAGYGHFSIRKERMPAHRASWRLNRGPIPAGMKILHGCDYRACVNPAHLRVGTTQDNVADRVARGRSAFGSANGSIRFPERRPSGDRNINRSNPEVACRGERHGRSKLTEADVLAIRASSLFQREIAQLFGISRGAVCSIRSGKNWRHVEGGHPVAKPSPYCKSGNENVVTPEIAERLRAFVGSHAEAARSEGVTYHSAYNVRMGKTWR